MKKLLRTLGLVLVLLIMTMTIAMPVSAGAPTDKGCVRGEVSDPLYPQLGPIKYLGNPAGYHFWFTVSANLGLYVEGHSYHNVYQVTVDDPSEWAGPIPVGGTPERAPYDLVRHTGESVYYKIFDTTLGIQVAP